MSYKITIEETALKTIHVGKRWVVITEVEGRSERGYAPETDSQEAVTQQVYEQTVEELDMKAIIATINGIHRAPEIS